MDAKPIIEGFISDIEEAKAIKLNANNSLKKIITEFQFNLKNLISIINNIQLKGIYLDFLEKANVAIDTLNKNEYTFELLEYGLKYDLKQYQKFLSN